MSPDPYIPALRFHRLTRFYDAVLARTMKEEVLKRRLIAQASLTPGQRALDLGCGTSTLTILMKQLHPEVSVHGLDADETALALARTKARAAGLEIGFELGRAQEPPFEPQSFDRVLSSLVFHHLKLAEKRRALAGIYRILKSGGALHIADWGRPRTLLQRWAFLPVQLLDGFETTRDSVRGIIPELMEEAGFVDVAETRSDATLFGTHALYRGRRP